MLTVTGRDVLVHNMGDAEADQLHFAWLYESPNGNWYMTYRQGGHGAPDGDVVRAVTSRDKGATWGAWTGIETAKPDFYQFFPTRLPDGSLICYRMPFGNLATQPDGTASGTQDMYRSADGGHTWTEYVARVTRTPYCATDASLKTLWGPGIQVSDGRLLMGIISREGNSRAGVVESHDAGHSYQYLASVCDDPSVGQRREPAIVQLPSGEVLAILRTGTNTSNMVLTRSSDGGRTWSAPQVLTEPGVCPQVRQLDSGAVVCTYGTRHYLHTMASWDDGTTWSTPLSIYEGSGTGYSSVQVLSADTYRVVYDESSFQETFQPGGNRIVRVTVKAGPEAIEARAQGGD